MQLREQMIPQMQKVQSLLTKHNPQKQIRYLSVNTYVPKTIENIMVDAGLNDIYDDVLEQLDTSLEDLLTHEQTRNEQILGKASENEKKAAKSFFESEK